MSPLSYPVFQGVDSNAQITYILNLFGLSETELGGLFHVNRQAVNQWRKRSIPAQRAAQVDRIVEFGQFLQRRLIPERIPTIVRTPAKGLDGRTMLDVLRTEGVAPLYRYMARLAEYSNT